MSSFKISPVTFDNSFPDPDTYTIVINEFQRKVFAVALKEFVQKHIGSSEHPAAMLEMAMCLDDLIDDGDNPLTPSPCVNGFVL